MVDTKFVKCPHCNSDVSEGRLTRHIRKVHSPLAEAKRQLEQEAILARKAKAEQMRQKVSCPTCGVLVALGQVKSHMGTVHSAPVPADLLRKMGEAPPVNRFRSASEREEYWRRLERGEDPKESNDLFDRTRVLQGGLFGLGKNRRH